MNYQLKAIILKNLDRLDDFLAELPILIPQPKEVFNLERNSAVIIKEDSTLVFLDVENKKVLLDDLNEILKEYSDIQLTELEPDDNDSRVLKEKNVWNLLDVNNIEGYNIDIENNRIIIYAIYEEGLFYGVQTLIQLIKNDYMRTEQNVKKERFIIPEMNIRDAPDIRMRGVTQDIARGQVFTLENAKRYIKILSHYKMNTYCLYLEDMVKCSKHPKIGKDRGALSPEDIRELDEFAKKRFINLIPIFECLGHVDNILMHKEYEHLGEFPGAQCLNVSNPEVLDFLEDYIKELSNIFSTNYFHIGCDESFDFGKYKSMELIKEKGRSRVLVEFYEKIYNLARKYGNKYVIMYDDIIRNNQYALKNLNKDIILMYWYYGEKKKESEIKRLTDAGFRVILSPSMLNWQRNFPDNITSNKNIINLTELAYQYRNDGCMGLLTSTWGDYRYYSLRENEIYGAILTGAITWNFKDFNLEEFKKKYAFQFYGLNREYREKFREMFNLISSSAEYYSKIAKIIPPMFYTYLFKHPFYSKKYKPPFKKYTELGKLSLKVMELYNDLRDKIRFEKENFEFIHFGAELALRLSQKIELSINTQKILNQKEIDEEKINSLIKEIEDFKVKLERLKNRYQELWLRAAQEPCLDVILTLFDYLIKCYDEKAKQIRKGEYFVDPYIPSEWIWVNEKVCPPEPRYFRKVINIEKKVKKALIQGIAGNYMKIFINGEFIGDVKSRFSLSILPIVKRVKVFDISKYLKSGNNIIAVEAYNFEGFKGAINIYGQILLEDDSILEIISDKSWLTYKKELSESDNWKDLNYDDTTWKIAKSYGRPPKHNGDIYKPNLIEGEISNTQDYFGIQGYFYNMVRDLISPVLMNFIKILMPPILKRLKPYG